MVLFNDRPHPGLLLGETARMRADVNPISLNGGLRESHALEINFTRSIRDGRGEKLGFIGKLHLAHAMQWEKPHHQL